jgi:hypothetical protein
MQIKIPLWLVEAGTLTLVHGDFGTMAPASTVEGYGGEMAKASRME